MLTGVWCKDSHSKKPICESLAKKYKDQAVCRSGIKQQASFLQQRAEQEQPATSFLTTLGHI